MSKKTKISLAVMASIVVLGGACLLTGCGGGSSSSSAGAPNGGGSTPPPGVTPRPEGPLQIVDANGDGTWDDIEAYINETYPNSAKERAFMAQYAQALQEALIDANDKTRSIQHSYEVDAAADCGEYVTGDRDRAEEMRLKLKARFLRIGQRAEVYYDIYDANLGGEMFESTGITISATSCTFNPAVLPN